jgi:hypothetical protein
MGAHCSFRGKTAAMVQVHAAMGIGLCLLTLATGCATTSAGQVQEVSPGIYSVGITRTYGITDKTKALEAAVTKAGEYCHAKGQKLLVTPSPESQSTLMFRCGTEG